MLCKGDQLILSVRPLPFTARRKKRGSPWPFSQDPAEWHVGRMSCWAGSSHHLSCWPLLPLCNGPDLVKWPGGPGGGGLPGGSLLPLGCCHCSLPRSGERGGRTVSRTGLHDVLRYQEPASSFCFPQGPQILPEHGLYTWLRLCKILWAQQFWEHTLQAYTVWLGLTCVTQWNRRCSLLFPEKEKMPGVCLARTARHHTIEHEIGLEHEEDKRFLKSLWKLKIFQEPWSHIQTNYLLRLCTKRAMSSPERI